MSITVNSSGFTVKSLGLYLSFGWKSWDILMWTLSEGMDVKSIHFGFCTLLVVTHYRSDLTTVLGTVRRPKCQSCYFC